MAPAKHDLLAARTEFEERSIGPYAEAPGFRLFLVKAT
jgi:hypothetical protein